MAVSGISGDAFQFLGFLPRRSKDRKAGLKSVASSPHPLIIYESPHRVKATLRDLLETLGDRKMAVCRELTKLHEEVFRGTVSEAILHFDEPRGEFVLVVLGASESESAGLPGSMDLDSIEQELARLRESGAKAKEAVALVAESSRLPKRAVYQMWLGTARR